jgi:hypothetical protein
MSDVTGSRIVFEDGVSIPSKCLFDVFMVSSDEIIRWVRFVDAL